MVSEKLAIEYKSAINEYNQAVENFNNDSVDYIDTAIYNLNTAQSLFSIIYRKVRSAYYEGNKSLNKKSNWGFAKLYWCW